MRGQHLRDSRSISVVIWRTWERGCDKITGKAFAYLAFEEIRRESSAMATRRLQGSAGH